MLQQSLAVLVGDGKQRTQILEKMLDFFSRELHSDSEVMTTFVYYYYYH